MFINFVEWVRASPIQASLAIFGLYVALIIFTFPIMYLTIALGFAFSTAFESRYLGYLYAWVLITFSVLMGGTLAMLISRYWLTKTIKRKFLKNHKSFLAVNYVLTKDGWKTVFLLRLTPLPFFLVSYFLGITSISVLEFILGTLANAIPIAIQLYIGQSFTRISEIKQLDDPNYQVPPFQVIMLMVEVMVAFFVGFLISYKAKLALDRSIERE